MFTTRSPFLPAPATEVLIVSHGSPSDPAPQEAFVRDLAWQVAHETGAEVRGATLAADGALEAAVAGLSVPVVFPHFMADGWFVSTNLQNRLSRAGLKDWTTLAPLGLLPSLVPLARRRVVAEMATAGFVPADCTLVIAAHGSPSNPRPAQATERFARALRDGSGPGALRLGFVDEEPSLADAARVRGPALVLPFFAARSGHVLMDLPEALEEAGFTGPVLPPIGIWTEIPALISAAIRHTVAA